jgi:hypothetical protein
MAKIIAEWRGDDRLSGNGGEVVGLSEERVIVSFKSGLCAAAGNPWGICGNEFDCVDERMRESMMRDSSQAISGAFAEIIVR